MLMIGPEFTDFLNVLKLRISQLSLCSALSVGRFLICLNKRDDIRSRINNRATARVYS